MASIGLRGGINMSQSRALVARDRHSFYYRYLQAIARKMPPNSNETSDEIRF